MSAGSGRPLRRDFFARPTLTVARDLLGSMLVHIEDGEPVGGPIVEVEAYIGEEDAACHARAGRTARTAVMYGPPGHAYVYFNYGMHWLFNIVTEAEGFPAAVLVRALRPEYGIERMERRRAPQPPHRWTDGPAKLCLALGLDGRCNGLDLCTPGSPVQVWEGEPVPDSAVTNSPRVGLNNVAEPWKSIRWRYLAT